MPIIDVKHVRMHPVEGDSAWSESYYFNAYDPDCDVGLYTCIGTDAGDLHRGWVNNVGGYNSIAEWGVRTELEADRVTQRVCHVTALDKRGRRHALRADLLRVSPGGVRPGGTIVDEGLARWTYEGVSRYGIAEYLHQFDAAGAPLVPID